MRQLKVIKPRVWIALALALSLTFGFQNCGTVEFRPVEAVALSDGQSVEASGKSCLFNGQTIPHSEITTAYQNSSVPFGQTCEPFTLTCNDGALPGSATAPFSSCGVNVPLACLHNGSAVAHGQPVTGYSTSTVPFGSTCASKVMTCANGVLAESNVYRFPSCVPGQPASCTLDGITVAHSGTISAYTTRTVPYGSTCTRSTLTCNNGQLPGSNTYPFRDCIVSPPPTMKAFAPLGFDYSNWNQNWSTPVIPGVPFTPTPGFGINSPGSGMSQYYSSKLAVHDSGWIGVTSGCGTFVSKDNGGSFSTLNTNSLPGDIISIAYDGNNVFAGTYDGLYKSSDQGASFQQILNMADAAALYSTTGFCDGISPNITFRVRKISASGNKLVLSTDFGLMYSNNGGASFSYSKVFHEGYLLPFISEVTDINFQQGNQVTVGLRPFFSVSSVQVRNSAGVCQIRNGWASQDYALLRSEDGGMTFTTKPLLEVYSSQVSGNRIVAHAMRDIRVNGIYDPNFDLIVSEDNGQSWTTSAIANLPKGPSFNPLPYKGLGYSVSFESGMAFLGNKIFAQYHSFNERDRLLVSSDNGRNYSFFDLDPSITGRFKIFSLQSNASMLVVSTNRGVYLSADGVNFTRKKFSSPYCASPWWKTFDFVSSNDNHRVLYNRTYSGLNKFERSMDGGFTFSNTTFPLDLNDFVGIGSHADTVQIGDNFIHGDMRGGAHAYNLRTGVFQKSTLGNFLNLSPLAINVGSHSGVNFYRGLYTDVGQQNPLAMISSARASAFMSVASINNTVVGGISRGFNNEPGVWQTSGFGVFQNGVMVNSFLDEGATAKMVRVINGKIFTFGTKLWTSPGNNTQFSVVPGSPRYPRNILHYEGNLYIPNDSLYYSTDGGATFRTWTGQLQ